MNIGFFQKRRLSSVRDLPKRPMIVFVSALLIRLIYISESSDDPFFSVLVSDSATYHDLAVSLSKGNIDWRFFFQGVFYPLFLYGVYSVFGPSVLVVKIIQAVVGATTALLTERVGARIGGERVGFGAGLVSACYGPLIFFDGELLATPFAALFLIALLLLFLKADETTAHGFFFGLGVVGGLSVLTRPIFLPLFLGAALWLIRPRRKKRARPNVSGVVGMGLGFLVVVAPLAIANHHITNHASFLPSSGGLNLYLGNNPDTCDTLTIRPGERWAALVNEPISHGYRLGAEKERYFNRKFLDYIQAEPARYLIGLYHKSVRFLNGREIPRNSDIYLHRETSVVLTMAVFKIGRFGFPMALLLPFSVLGLVFWRHRYPGYVYLFLVVYPLSVIAVFVTARYRVPFVPLLAVLAGTGAAALADAIRRRLGRRLLEMGVVAGVTMAGAVLPPTFCEEKVDLAAEQYHMGAMFLVQQREPDKAIEYLDSACEINPRYQEAFKLLGIVLNENRRPERALTALRTAVRLKGDDPDALKYLGKTLGQLNRFEEGEAALKQALELKPRDGYAHLYLGICLANRRKLGEAHGHLESATKLLPRNRLARETLLSVSKALGIRGE